MSATQLPTATFLPGVSVDDPLAAYWLNQATLRLRRELAWLWQQQGMPPETPGVPRFRDKVSSVLDQKRFHEEKMIFFQKDPTARYLSEQIAAAWTEKKNAPWRGSFSWLAGALELDGLETFALALALMPAVDSSAGAVIAACVNEPGRTQPTLALIQRLWDRPEAVLKLADPLHALYRCGVMQLGSQESSLQWERPLSLPPLIAQQLLFPAAPWLEPWGTVERVDSVGSVPGDSEDLRLLVARLSFQSDQMQCVPVVGAKGAASCELVQAVERLRGRTAMRFAGDYQLLKQPGHLNTLAAWCWLRNLDLFFDQDQVAVLLGDRLSLETEQLPLLALPVTVFLALTDRRQVGKLPSGHLLPVLEVPRLTYRERHDQWQRNLGDQAESLEETIAEVSRRFRFESNTINRVCRDLKSFSGQLTAGRIMQICRSEAELDMGELAQPVAPRFTQEELILPAKQTEQFQEIIRSMRSLTKVHYQWGTEKVWNESGISVLFAGAPGTGKTMAAEILALTLDLPIFRIDLSQVASKYIGETEKNLKKVFDAADVSDTILFFDEADALFGRRTEVKDAHDRYANLEISYLLERMERFKGLAILATNRKKDLDEAFLRRLRYIVDFPLPGEEERRRIWRQMVPKTVDASALDLDFLAKQFPLAGGHIRSIVFNACLQSAQAASPLDNGFQGRLDMETVLTAVKREYEKLSRAVSLEQFGSYATRMEQREAGHA